MLPRKLFYWDGRATMQPVTILRSDLAKSIDLLHPIMFFCGIYTLYIYAVNRFKLRNRYRSYLHVFNRVYLRTVVLVDGRSEADRSGARQG